MHGQTGGMVDRQGHYCQTSKFCSFHEPTYVVSGVTHTSGSQYRAQAGCENVAEGNEFVYKLSAGSEKYVFQVVCTWTASSS